MQHVERNMMLWYVALKCCTRLGTLLHHLTTSPNRVPPNVLDVNSVAVHDTCCVEMFRAFVWPEDAYRNLDNLRQTKELKAVVFITVLTAIHSLEHKHISSFCEVAWVRVVLSEKNCYW